MLPHRILGGGPGVVVLIHGVGVDARSFRSLADRLRHHLTVVVPDRSGYGAARHRPTAATLSTQVDDLERLLEVVGGKDGSCGGGEPMVVGVSGGATLALALAIRRAGGSGARPDGRTVVVHEPLLGGLAPTLAEVVSEGHARTLARDPMSADRYLRDLVGTATWDLVGAEGQAQVAADAGVIAAEVPAFIAFSPTKEELRSLEGSRLVSSVGATSPAPRREASAVLTELAGAREVTVEGAGHLPQIDAPDRFAHVLLGLHVDASPPAAVRSFEEPRG